MADTDIVRLDAATLGQKIAAKELSSTEVTAACLDRIAAIDERYHAFLHVAGEQALAAAARVPRADKGAPPFPDTSSKGSCTTTAEMSSR